jgi:4-hydroxybenzoate polyprenyltransferase
MNEVIKYYRLFNVLSLDVAAGAIVSSLFFAKLYSIIPSLIPMISLGLTVWLIYTADRLLDVKDIHGEVTSERHQFHKRNQRELTYWLAFIMIIDLALIFFMPTTIIKRGILLSMFVIIYIVVRKRLYLFKEFFVAVLYTAGVILPAIPENQFGLDAYLPILQFFFIALLNLVIFSWYERQNDLKDKQESIATILSERAIRSSLLVLFIISFSISVYMTLLVKAYLVSMVFVIMTAILFLICWRKPHFEKNDYYRWVGDSIFLFPLIYLLL